MISEEHLEKIRLNHANHSSPQYQEWCDTCAFIAAYDEQKERIAALEDKYRRECFMTAKLKAHIRRYLVGWSDSPKVMEAEALLAEEPQARVTQEKPHGKNS